MKLASTLLWTLLAQFALPATLAQDASLFWPIASMDGGWRDASWN